MFFGAVCVQDEFDNLQKWFNSPSPQPENSWQAWNAESWRAAANAAGKQMGRLGACVRAHILKLPTLVMVLAAVARMKEKSGSRLPKWAVALILAGGNLLCILYSLIIWRLLCVCVFVWNHQAGLLPLRHHSLHSEGCGVRLLVGCVQCWGLSSCQLPTCFPSALA